MKFIIDRKEFYIMDDKELLKLTPGELVDLGICPTCFNRKHNGALYGDKLIAELSKQMTFDFGKAFDERNLRKFVNFI
jgi:hypothetical protein